jgi:hypothetical protein
MNTETDTVPAVTPVETPSSPTTLVESPTKTVEQVQAQLDAANAELSALRAQKDADSADEILIQAKMGIGLTRAQATSVVRRQHAFDESPHGKMTRARHEARQNSRTRI